jgi:hypothetical protein
MTGLAMTVRWTTPGAVVVREPTVLEASAVSSWVMGGMNGSVGDGVREHDGYQQSRRVRVDIEAGCTSALEESWTRARPWFLEEDLERFMGMVFMGTDGEAEVGTL